MECYQGGKNQINMKKSSFISILNFLRNLLLITISAIFSTAGFVLLILAILFFRLVDIVNEYVFKYMTTKFKESKHVKNYIAIVDELIGII